MSHYNILCLDIPSSAVFQFLAYIYVVKVKGDGTVSFKNIGGGYSLAGIRINLVVEDCHSYLQGTWTASTLEIPFL